MPADNEHSQPRTDWAGAPAHPEHRSIGTSGGDYAEGNIDKRHGTFIDRVEGHVIIEEAERAYEVHGLPNPFLGLRSFTYDDRERYAGRERTIESAVQKLTAPGEQRTLLFITGASGSGKSSFAQAGLLPALEMYYDKRGLALRGAIIRPSSYPLAALLDALMQLGLPAHALDLQAATTSAAFYQFMQDNSPPSQINVLIIDQFEELFTQSEPNERDALFTILEELPSFSALHMHIIATLRSDYLPELFEHKVLYDIVTAEQRIDLRAMCEADLREAILHPIQQRYPNAEKRLEDALLEKLARDASGEAAYLPLLQVTLEDMWLRGSLKLSAYGTLTDAIQRRAEEAYTYADAEEQQPRSAADQVAITQIFLDLVEVSLDDDSRRDVRRRRTYAELTHGSPVRARLVEELCTTRLLSKSLETRGSTQVEVVDIIHESLIGNWERLCQATVEQRTVLQQRVRFEQALQEWLEKGRSSAYLLTGVRLAEAQELERKDNIALRGVAAQDLLRESITRRQAEQQRQLHRVRLVAIVLAVLLVAALAASGYAVNRQGFAEARRAEADQQREIAQTQQAAADQQRAIALQRQAEAERQERISRAQALAANAVTQLEQDPERSILLAVEAISTTWRTGEPVVVQAEDALHQGLLRSHVDLTLRGHTKQVYSASYSPDGRSIVTVGLLDETPKVWDAETGQEQFTLSGHTEGVTSASYSPDGRLIVTASRDNTAMVWDTTTGQERLTLSGHTAEVTSASYSPDGHFIVTASEDRTAKVWDATSGQEQFTLSGHTNGVFSAAYSPDGRYILTAGRDQTAKVWDAETGQEQFTLSGHDKESLGGAKAVYSPDGRFILTYSSDGTAKVWDAASGQVQFTLRHPEGLTLITWILEASYSPDGRFIVTGGADGTAKVWDAASGQERLTLSGHGLVTLGGVGMAQLTSAAYSPDGRFIVTGSVDGTAKVWDVTSSQERVILRGYESMATAAYSPDGHFVVTVSYDGTMKVWDAATGQERVTLRSNASHVRSVAYSPDGRYIVIAGNDDEIVIVKIWDASNVRKGLTLHSSHVLFSASYSPDGRFILAGVYNGMVQVWDAVTGQERFTLRGHGAGGTWAAYSPDGRFIVAASFDGTVQVWDAVTGQERLTFVVHEKGMNSAAYSPDGRFIITASEDGTANVWDAVTGQERLTLRGHTGEVNSAAYSPDGRFIVTASDDKTVKVWDAATGRERLTLRGHVGSVTSATYSPDGRFILTASTDETARQYVMDVGELLRLAQSRVTRPLTDAERIQFDLD